MPHSLAAPVTTSPTASAAGTGRPGVVAVFDLDGTLTYRDTFIPWVLGFVAPRPTRWWRLLVFLPLGLAVLCGARDRGMLKAWLLRALAGGAEAAVLDRWSQIYAQRVVDQQLRQGAVAAPFSIRLKAIT